MTAATTAACPFCGVVHHKGYFPKRTQIWAHGERIRTAENELIVLYDRIRVLEARIKELEALAEDLRLDLLNEISANKELSAMLYELRSQRDYAIAVQEDRER